MSIAKAKPFVTSPPTKNKMRMVRNTVSEVMMVRLNVSLIALLITASFGAPIICLLYSRILSNTITVSFMENPITVNTAAMKCWSNSRGKGTTVLKNENTASVTSTSCSNAMMVPREYLQPRKRMKIYSAIITSDQKVAHLASRFKSSEMVGNTVVEPTLYSLSNCW